MGLIPRAWAVKVSKCVCIPAARPAYCKLRGETGRWCSGGRSEIVYKSIGAAKRLDRW
jgi:hypothetical protein